jgi:gliding motility-associated-like protein
MPNVFTPNGDGVNDVFMPKYIHEDAEDFDICTTTVYQLELFNQWGKNVFSSKTDKELPQWDGENSRNTNLREGLYFYKIKYQLNTYPEGFNHNMSGYFQIYR